MGSGTPEGGELLRALEDQDQVSSPRLDLAVDRTSRGDDRDACITEPFRGFCHGEDRDAPP